MNDEPYPATAQFHENLDDILSLLERKLPAKYIWRRLVAKGSYTGDYSYFCRLIKKTHTDESHSTSGKEPITDSNQEKSNTKGPKMYLDDLST